MADETTVGDGSNRRSEGASSGDNAGREVTYNGETLEERLRRLSSNNLIGWWVDEEVEWALDEIDRLRAELKVARSHSLIHGYQD